MDIQAAINRIKYYAFAEMGWSKNRLAKEAEVSFNAVDDIHADTWNPTLAILRKLESVVPESFSLAHLTAGSTPKKENDNEQ